MIRSPPLRFLALALGGWVGVRAAVLTAPWWVQPAVSAPHMQRQRPPAPRLVQATGPPVASAPASRTIPSFSVVRSPAAHPFVRSKFKAAFAAEPMLLALAFDLPPGTAAARPPLHTPLLISSPALHRASRWSVYAWTFLRGGDGPALAPSGTLGGSQFGVRVGYRLNGDLAATVRLSSPARSVRGAEAAVGLEWQPVKAVPLHLLAERRQALGREGRSAFGLTVHGGVSDAPVAGPLRLDAYAQAGVVGTRSNDLFGDGGARLSLPLDKEGRLKLGAGAWGAAQPGVSRLDIGPQASAQFRIGVANLTVAADWHLRIAGSASPGSGPALTISTGF
jgi:hypothetical protein